MGQGKRESRNKTVDDLKNLAERSRNREVTEEDTGSR